jgi:hypothetical protein
MTEPINLDEIAFNIGIAAVLFILVLTVLNRMIP